MWQGLWSPWSGPISLGLPHWHLKPWGSRLSDGQFKCASLSVCGVVYMLAQVNNNVSNIFKSCFFISVLYVTSAQQSIKMLPRWSHIPWSNGDWITSMLLGASAKVIQRLKWILQNMLARVVARQHGHTSISVTLRELHWLPIKWKINFKVAMLSYKTLESGEPSHLASKTIFAIPRQSLRSSADTTGSSAQTEYWFQSFSTLDLSMWNSLPLDVQIAPSTQTFKSRWTLWTCSARASREFSTTTT